MTALLASVSSLDEARLAAEYGVDFIDLKNPAEGALGALPLPLIRQIVTALAGRGTLSATIGDLPMSADLLYHRVAETAETGVDIVKIGFFGKENHSVCIEALAPLAKKNRLIAVLLVDEGFNSGLLPWLGEAGFYGVMLDTAGKQGGRLTEWKTLPQLQEFVDAAHACGLVCGLAGSLSLEDVSLLSGLGADYLGFRRALCAHRDRNGPLDPVNLGVLRRLLQKSDMSYAVIV